MQSTDMYVLREAGAQSDDWISRLLDHRHAFINCKCREGTVLVNDTDEQSYRCEEACP